MTGKRFALIIANYQYEDKNLHKLEAPAYDARDLEEVLKKPDIAGFEVTTLVNGSAETIRREIARLFAKKRRDDLLLLYFSGHGMLDVKGRLYLAIKDTNLDLLSGTAIEAAFVTKEMNDSDSRRQLLILDCCNSGAFERGMRGPGASVHTCDVFEATGVGRFVMTATDATQYAWEGDKLIGEAKNSIFTHYLIKGLKGEAADDNGAITFDSLYDYVNEQVVKETPKQTPCKWTYKQEGKLVIARAKPRPTELPSDLEEKIKSYDSRVRLIAVRDLVELLHGRRIGLALAAYYALERLSKDDSRMVSKAAEEGLMGCPDEIRKIVQLPPLLPPSPPDIIKLSADARELFRKGKYEEAIEKWREVLKLDSENRKAIEGIEEAEREEINKLDITAQQLCKEEKYSEAIDAWEKVLDLDPKNQTAKEGVEKAKRKLREKISKLSSQAQKLFEEKRYAEAIGKWQEVLKLDSENSEAIKRIEEAERFLGKLEEKKRKINELKKGEEKLKEKVKKYCPNCGYPNEPGFEYCMQCGAKLFGMPENL